ncbi:glycosyl hydrolase family 95 catalytic domain-containing protein [Streptomyces fildesensis]|uniref:Glycosyl hydrolase family 95 catalytic domain-containing protein n=1 Tax=Streptomyces fildesensis TaxID=375757 RepID=A0ABW8C2N8_9ACTN
MSRSLDPQHRTERSAPTEGAGRTAGGSSPSRRAFLGGSAGAILALAGLPRFTAHADPAMVRPSSASLVPEADAVALWYPAPASEATIMEQGLPIGNGRLGAMVGGHPSRDFLYLSDATLWTGGPNASLGSDGQFPYGAGDFGTFGLLAKAFLNLPAHTPAAVTDYRRRLDLSNGLVTATYRLGGVTYRREVYSSHPDEVIVVRLTQSGGGSYTGGLTLNGTRGEAVTSDGTTATASFAGTLANGLKYATAVRATGTGGTLSATGSDVTFSGCTEVLLVISGGTNYSPTAAGFKDPSADPKAIAATRAATAAGLGGAALLATHTADYQALFTAMTVSLGTSSAAQRALDTGARLTARAASGAAPDPELEASYLQFGRYLMITGSRGSAPLNLQGLWLDRNDPDWMGDYHTDINVQMNYWLADRAGLAGCFEAFAEYCLGQLPYWQDRTRTLFNDSRNGFRNSNGRIAGWTTAISTNVWGGLGWWWHPAGNAWIGNSLFEHYEYTQDAGYLARIYPLLKGACEFWEARLITTTVTDPATGVSRQVLIDDSDWSPEQGPTNAKGITYAQELVWQLFENYRTACAVLNRDGAYAATVAGLQSRLYLPQVSATTGWLEEWMSNDNLGETTHRHLSPLIGLFPGDRINPATSPPALLTGVTNLLTARGMESFGWACAWRALCWARLRNADKAYQLVLTVLKPSVNHSNGAAANLFDMYSMGSRSTFQIDANFGTPSAMIEMLVQSRPGTVELLPALPGAWAAAGSVTGIGVRGGFTVGFAWSAGQVTSITLHSVGGTRTTVRAGAWTQDVTLSPGGTTTLVPTPAPTVFTLVNRRSGKAIDVPGGSTSTGTALIQYGAHGGTNQQWTFTGTGAAGSERFRITNVHSGLAMDVSGGSTADGAAIIQWTPSGSTNQQWTLTDAGGGYVKIVSLRSGKLLGVAGDSTADLAAVVQQTDTGSSSQQWRRTAV